MPTIFRLRFLGAYLCALPLFLDQVKNLYYLSILPFLDHFLRCLRDFRTMQLIFGIRQPYQNSRKSLQCSKQVQNLADSCCGELIPQSWQYPNLKHPSNFQGMCSKGPTFVPFLSRFARLKYLTSYCL